MTNRYHHSYILILLLCISTFFYTSCNGTNGPSGPFECEIQFINNHPTLQYSLFLGINDNFFDKENVGGTDVSDGEEVIVDVAPDGGTGNYIIDLDMNEEIQKDWLIGTYVELGGVWSFLLPTPIEDGDGFTFNRDTSYTIELQSDGNTVTISD